MKSGISLMALCIALFAATAWSQPTAEELRLKGPLQTVEVSKVALSTKLRAWFAGPEVQVELMALPEQDGSVAGTLFEKQSYVYDPNHRILHKSVRRGDDRVTEQTVYTYDERGNCLRIESTHQNPALDWIRVMSYDSENFLLRRDEINVRTERTEVTAYTYDQQHRLMEETLSSPADHPLHRMTYAYNPEGRVQSIAQYNPQGELQVRRIFVYDAQGNPLNEMIYNGKEQLTGEWISRFDGNGNLLQQNLVTQDARGTENSRHLEYDEQGNVTRLSTFGKHGDAIDRKAYRYEYDHYGNWIKKVTCDVFDDRPDEILHPVQAEYRSITYYPEQP